MRTLDTILVAVLMILSVTFIVFNGIENNRYEEFQQTTWSLANKNARLDSTVKQLQHKIDVLTKQDTLTISPKLPIINQR